MRTSSLPFSFCADVSPRRHAVDVDQTVSLGRGGSVHPFGVRRRSARARAHRRAVPGARLAAGTNWFVSRHFLVGLEANYHAVGKFDQPDALTENASGFGMSLSFGICVGRALPSGHPA